VDDPKGDKSGPLHLAIVAGYEREEERTAWQDGEKGLLERRIAQIVLEIVTMAELNYRQGCIRQFEWRVQRKARLEEELQRHLLELERQQRERQDSRIDRLLDETASLRRAADIRAYVPAAKDAIGFQGISAPADELARWTRCALAQADRIDPVKNGRFSQGFEGDGSSEK
jgi:hypothetical protein